MKIKTENGEVNVASQGQSNLNTVLGAVGTAGSMGILSGILGGNRNQQPQSDGDRPVTRFEMGLYQQITKAARKFWFHDEDMPEGNKVYWYFKDKIFG